MRKSTAHGTSNEPIPGIVCISVAMI